MGDCPDSVHSLPTCTFEWQINAAFKSESSRLVSIRIPPRWKWKCCPKRRGLQKKWEYNEEDDALPPRYKTLYDDLTFILREMRDSGVFPSQETIDTAYSILVSNILQRTMTYTKPRGKRGRPEYRRPKRKKKRYLYARTQELYKKDPNVLAKHICEGNPWTEDPGGHIRTGENKRILH